MTNCVGMLLLEASSMISVLSIAVSMWMTEGWWIIKGNSFENLAGHGGHNYWLTSNIDVAVLGQSKNVIKYYLKFSLFLYNHSVNEVFHVSLHEKAQFNSLWFSVDNVVLKMVFELSQMFVFGTTQDIASLIWHTQNCAPAKICFQGNKK